MRCLVLGDLHNRKVWKDIVTKEGDSCDKIIFLGDYLPPRHDVMLDDPTDSCGFLYEVLAYKDQNPNKVVLLRGNHDLDLLGYYWAECYPKAHPKVYQYCQTKDVKNWFLNNTQWVYIIPDTNIVCSHAGIGNYFLDKVREHLFGNNPPENYTNLWLIKQINFIEPCELFAFNGGWFDTNGESFTQPCTWIRPETLAFHGIKDIVHVVGHTPVRHIHNVHTDAFIKAGHPKDGPDIWTCDCLEHREYLIIEDTNFKTYEFQGL